MTVKQSLIAIAMACDPRIPRSAIGYVSDLNSSATEAIIADRLAQLARYVPDRCQKYKQ